MKLAVVGRWIVAVFASSVLAALTVAAQFGVVAVVGELLGAQGSAASACLIAGAGFYLSLPCFFLGVAILGAPAARRLTRLKLDHALPIGLLGGAISTLVGAIVLSSTLGSTGLVFAFTLPLAGATLGLTYRELMKPPS
ncbi:hypothetical protein [Brevundimonas sp.]|uniref:hypothetical protein n=1 Tax=Brevundimonas sp. TaxID=1871086 RepID=UPI002899FA97|nr:hypothetical protein [Brevundimonas sp.]